MIHKNQISSRTAGSLRFFFGSFVKPGWSLRHPEPAVLWIGGFWYPNPTVLLFWTCSNTRNRLVFETPKTGSPLGPRLFNTRTNGCSVLGLFNYPDPTVVLFWTGSNTRNRPLFSSQCSSTRNRRVLSQTPLNPKSNTRTTPKTRVCSSCCCVREQAQYVACVRGECDPGKLPLGPNCACLVVLCKKKLQHSQCVFVSLSIAFIAAHPSTHPPIVSSSSSSSSSCVCCLVGMIFVNWSTAIALL